MSPFGGRVPSVCKITPRPRGSATSRSSRCRRAVAQTLLSAASTLLSTLFLVPANFGVKCARCRIGAHCEKRREESRRGKEESLRHVYKGGVYWVSSIIRESWFGAIT